MQETRDISSVTSDITWMTYAELGRTRGISAASAKRLAIRRHWRRHQGNDGTARVAVPVTEAVRRAPRTNVATSDSTSDDTSDRTGDVTPIGAVLSVIETAHAGEIAALRERIEVAERDKLAVQALADRALTQATDAMARADRAEAERDRERQRSDTLHRGLTAAEALVTELRGDLEAARQQAGDAQAAAEAIQAELQAAQAKAQQAAEVANSARRTAESTRDEERSRADGLVKLLEATQLELAEQCGLTDQANAARREAAQTIHTLRRAEEAQKARGRLRRVWAAWRGE